MSGTWADVDIIVEQALADGSTVVVELDAGQFDLAGDDLLAEWEALAPGEAFEIIAVRPA